MNRKGDRKRKRHYCPHCDEFLFYKTFCTHKRRFFNKDNEEWLLGKEEIDLDMSSDNDFSNHETDNYMNHTDDDAVESPPPILESDIDIIEPDSMKVYSTVENLDSLESDCLNDDSSDDKSEQFENNETVDSDQEVWEEDLTSVEDSSPSTDGISLFESENCQYIRNLQEPGTSKVEVLVTWIILYLAALQRKHLIPDVAIECLLKFLKAVFRILSSFSAEIAKLYDLFPSSLYCMLKYTGIHRNDFTMFVVCPNSYCCTLYKYDVCIVGHGIHRESKHCSAIIGTKKCNALLLKKVHLTSGKIVFHPFKIYCYRSVKKSLSDLLKRQEIYIECEKQRTISCEGSSDYYADIYDGKIWKKFQNFDGKPFLSEKNNYAMMINIDWFQPFKRTQYSLGAIYMSIINLPRHLRFKPENILLVGLIPGPEEPKLTVNTFLQPLVDEMLEFWNGVPIQISQQQLCVVRCALICVACDLPATRKVCGLLSYSATLGCSRCYKKFPGGAGKKNYSGFKREKWKKRSVEKHRKHVDHIACAATIEQKKHLVKKYGCRYSELLRLSYFDPIKMAVIDPMHCLYLGITKHVIKRLWIESGILTTDAFHTVEDTMNKVNFPSAIGRIPVNALNSFASFTADQLKNWTNVFSLFAMREVLKDEHWECWKHFVLASRILCQKQLSHRDIIIADGLILQFCNRVERIYGEKCITPNMHLACHLKKCIKDFGPLQSFWLFPFERYNGIIENMPSNKRMIEAQFMRRFLRDMNFLALSLPSQLSDELSPHFSHLLPSSSGSILESEQISQDAYHLVYPRQFMLSSFDCDELKEILSLYRKSIDFLLRNQSCHLVSGSTTQ